MTKTYGDFKLASVAKLPNIKLGMIGGEHYSDGKASEIIVPGELVVQGNVAGKKSWARAAAGAITPLHAVAMRCVDLPDASNGSLYSQPLGPNEITNLPIQVGEYVHAYHTFVGQITLIKPDSAYVPGDYLTWDPTGTRPTGKTGTGSWTRTGATATNAFFIVEEFLPLPDLPTLGRLVVKSVRPHH